MCEWRLTPEYIFDNWTEEVFTLMVDKLVERKARERDSVKKKPAVNASDEMLFAKMGSNVKVVKE